MPRACRNALATLNRNDAQHAGLLLDRYLRVPYKDDSHPEERQKLFTAARKALFSSKAIYQKAFSRFQETIKTRPSHVSHFLKTKNRLIIGLSSSSSVETGVTLHHIYGTPIIPGSAIKGLTSHFCNIVWGEKDSNFKSGQKYHKIIFGNNDDSGHIIFYDAWIIPGSIKPDADAGLIFDIMTPHHQDYYQGDRPPTDFDDPNPISFLSIHGVFLFILGCDVADEQGEKWAALTMNILTEALTHWGIGGKTSAGYGRFELESSSGSGTGNEPLSIEDIKKQVEEMSPKQLKAAFGKNWKDTQKRYQNNLELFKKAVRELHEKQIQTWEISRDKKERRIARRILENGT